MTGKDIVFPGLYTRNEVTESMFDDEAVSKFEDLVDSIVTIIETGDLQGLEDTIEDILEAGLFGVTVLQPNILLAIFMIMQVETVQ